MKILLVSDLHYALKQYDWTAQAARGFDLVIVAGDHIDIAGQLDGAVQIVVLLKYFRRLAAESRLVVSSGNHDLDARNAAGEKIASWMQRVRQLGIAADGDSILIDDTLITVCPWWDGPVSKEAVEAQLARDALAPKRAWHWVYHAPPADSPTSWNGRRSFGDADLSAWISRYRPNVVYTGHIHEAPFKSGGSWADKIGDTWVFNCGRQIGPTPTHIAIDSERGEAVWLSLAGAERVQLEAPLERPFSPLDTLPDWLVSNPARGPIPA